jgi:hypothetical protein
MGTRVWERGRALGRRIGMYAIVPFAISLASLEGTARGEEFYYVMIFGSQSHPKLLRYTHTWATFVRAVGEGPDPSSYALQVHTISWLPQAIELHVWRLWPEPGVNLDLYQTLDVVRSSRQNVTMWGPFLIRKEVYDKSLWVLQVIASGAPQYRCISTPGNLLISDCIHAVAAADPVFGRGHYPLIRIGKPASRFIARQLMTRSPIPQKDYDNSWLIPRLGLDRYPIEIVSPQQIPMRNCVLCRCPD